MIKNYGLHIDPVGDPNAYTLGGLTELPKEILQPDGQWDDYLPEVELQFEEQFDTYNCTAFGTTSIIEMLIRKLYNK